MKSDCTMTMSGWSLLTAGPHARSTHHGVTADLAHWTIYQACLAQTQNPKRKQKRTLLIQSLQHRTATSCGNVVQLRTKQQILEVELW